MGIFGKIFANAKEALSDTKMVALASNRQFMEGAMAWCAIMAWSDGEVEAAEKAKMARFIERHPSLKHFDKSQCIAAYKKIDEEFDFDFGMGRTTALKQIQQVTDPDQKHTMAQLALAIANSDGELEDAEVKQFRWVCDKIGLDANSYLEG